MKKFKQLKKFLNQNNAEDALNQVLHAFYKKMSQDVMIGFFFAGKDLLKIIAGQKELLQVAFGYKKKYNGVPVHMAHQNLPPLRRGHFNRRLVLLESTLKEHKFPEGAINEWINFERQFENVLVKE